jgi:hypothetical protein
MTPGRLQQGGEHVSKLGNRGIERHQVDLIGRQRIERESLGTIEILACRDAAPTRSTVAGTWAATAR